MQASLPNLYRIGRAPEPLEYAPYQFCGKNRFDDPLLAHGEHSSCFRALYLAEQRITCFLEVLQAHRPDLAYLARLAALPDGDAVGRGLYDEGYRAIVYISRFGCEYHCVALFEGATFAPLSDPEIIAANDPDLAGAVRLFGLTLDPLYQDAVSNRAD
jgi:hypothetical protein